MHYIVDPLSKKKPEKRRKEMRRGKKRGKGGDGKEEEGKEKINKKGPFMQNPNTSALTCYIFISIE